MATVNFVHCVDTEGPLHESLEDTAADLRETFGLTIEPTQEALERLQRGEGVPEAIKAKVMTRYSRQRLEYNRDWSMIDRMHETVFDAGFRDTFRDDFGSPYRLNWFCLDHAGFVGNPRRRTLGYGLVYSYYAALCRRHPHVLDRLYWHMHPVPFNREANCQGLSIQNNNVHLTSLAHRVIDHLHFPAVFRPGYHQEKTDLNLFLEQWIPFDHANLNGVDHQGWPARDYRFWDWRGAPDTWRPYHPSFDSSARPGSLRRWIARSLTLSTRFCGLTKTELVRAFQHAETEDVLVSVNSHDTRNMVHEILELRDLIQAARAEANTSASLRFCNASEGIIRTEGIEPAAPVEIESSIHGDSLEVRMTGDAFCFQPFLAFRTATGDYLHDNFSRGSADGEFLYIFDRQTIPIESIESIGLAATNRIGDVTVVRHDISAGSRTTRLIRALDCREFVQEQAAT